MRHEPRTLVGDSQHAMKLMGAHAFLAGTQQMKGEKPFIQGNVAVLKDRPDRDGELFMATAALVDALSGVRLGAFLRLKLGCLTDHAAMRANDAVRPALRFQIFTGLVSVGKVRGE